MNKFAHPLKVGIGFGLTSGVITTLGLMIGLYSGSHSRAVVLGGVFTIAIADAFSDALGIHISEESEQKHDAAEIWVATLTTFLSKFLCALSFSIPLFLFTLMQAIIVNIFWGFLLIGLFSYYISKSKGIKAIRVIAEHLLLTVIVLVLAHLTGKWVSTQF